MCSGGTPLLEASRRSGHAQEASILLLTHAPWCLACASQKLIEQNVDIAFSAGFMYGCRETEPTSAEYVNDMYNDNILVFYCAANESNCGTVCNTCDEAAAAGSIAVGQIGNSTGVDIDSQTLCTNSSGGDDTWGPVVDLVAPSAPYSLTTCSGLYRFPDASCGGTSYAVPQVAGAGALLMDFWIANFSDGSAHQPGRMHAVMLNMGDGCGGITSVAGDWGTGRLKMRRYDTYGMDTPYGLSATAYAFSPSDSWEYWPVNLSGGVNQPLSADVDALSTTMFCYYDGFDYSALPTFSFRVCWFDDQGGAHCTYANQTRGEKAIVRINPPTEPAEVRLSLYNIPAGKTVPCYINWVWEDSDRDDANGPPADINPYPPGGIAPSCSNGC